jgi:hypothetical protein
LTSGFFYESVSPGPLEFEFEFLRKFAEIFTTLKMAQMGYSWALRKLIHGKILKSKISCQTALKNTINELVISSKEVMKAFVSISG